MDSASTSLPGDATDASRRWLCGILLFSVVLRAVTAAQLPTPWLVDEELAQTSLARSIATPDTPVPAVPASVRSAPLYATVIAPLFGIPSLPTAYALVKLLNAVLVSLAAIPIYALARRVVAARWALVAAGLSLGIPSLGYTSAAVPDNLLFPLVAWAALALVGVLERPSIGRQVLLWVVVALACATRPEAAAVGVGVVVALVAWVAARRVAPAALVPSLLGAVGLGAALVACGAIHIESASAPLVAKLAGRHVGALALVHGVVPLAAFVGFVAVGARPVAVAMGSLALALVTAAALTAASRDGFSILERDVFALAPFGMIALAWWAAEGRCVRAAVRVPVALFAGGVSLAPWLLPAYSLAGTPDALGLFALRDTWAPVIRIATVVAALVGVAALALPRLARSLPAAVALVLVVVHIGVERQIVAHAYGVRWPVLRRERDWVDRTVPPRTEVVAVRSPAAEMLAFFNRRIVQVVDQPPAAAAWIVGPDGSAIGGEVVMRDDAAGIALSRAGVPSE